MGNKKMPVSVIGLGYSGRQLVDALKNVKSAEIVGISDIDRHVAELVGNETRLPYFSDNRQMVLQTSPRAVFVSTPPSATGNILKFCASRGIAVWTESPLARNLEEAIFFIRMFKSAGIPFVVGSQRRFMDSYMMAKDLQEKLGRICMSLGHYVFDWSGPLGWRGDRVSAGGGALLELGYHFADLLVWYLGLPDSVYGVATRSQPDRAPECFKPDYDTDDIAMATWRYQNLGVASLSVSRISGPCSEKITLYGGEGSITADSENCLYRDSTGELKEHFQFSATPTEPFRRQATEFMLAVDEKSRQYRSPAAEGLLAHAVIDSIYLSCRTSQPESPLRQLQIYGIEPEECLKHSVRENTEKDEKNTRR